MDTHSKLTNTQIRQILIEEMFHEIHERKIEKI